ncbi:Protein of unknown function [Pyronema omphalodes CBS 100304]|uniref:Uncharacterized protein n=1 Tax=Pyronema omphalodes (strain CBS 100304) TaxID=1076935 RepID=U4KVH5_PYROM|nr:Protein of unknown function [Pyronema omphalodes CBS 100304]
MGWDRQWQLVCCFRSYHTMKRQRSSLPSRSAGN